MSDVMVRTRRCAGCNGALEHTVDDEIALPAIGSFGVETEEREFICDECCTRLAQAHQNQTPPEKPARRRA